MSVDVVTEIDIDRTVDVVAAYAADPANAPEWYANIDSAEWKTEPLLQVGSTVAFVARFLGRRLVYDYVFVEFALGERLVMRTSQGPFAMETTYTWATSATGGTHMTLRNRGEPAGFSRLVAPIMAPAMRRANRKDLARLKSILEKGSIARTLDRPGSPLGDVVAMWTAREQLRIAASPEAVWRVVADVEAHTRLAGSGEVKAIRMSGPVAAGTTFEGEITTGEVGSFVSRNVIEAADEPRRLAWVSYPPLDEGETLEHQIEVHWAFELVPDGDGALLTHTFVVPRPKAGGDELASFLDRTGRISTVRAGMLRTLENVRIAAEGVGDPSGRP